MNTPATVSAGLYELLLVAYPQQFRRKYGPEMASVFADSCRYAYESSGFHALTKLWFTTLQDLVISVIAEHVSTFVSATRRDLLVISRAPMFVAACGALVGALFFIAAAFVRVGVNHEPASVQQFASIGIAAVNIASLWLASVFALHLLRRVLGTATFDRMQFMARLRAFKRVATISSALAFAAIVKYAFFDARVSATGLHSLPAPGQWFVFPLVLLCTVSAIILLDPLLTLRTSMSHRGNKHFVESAGTVQLLLKRLNNDNF